MTINSRTWLRLGAVIAVCSLGLSPVATPMAAHQLPELSRAVAAQAAPAVDGGWPKSFMTTEGATLMLYQPQIVSWRDQKHLTLYAVVSYLPPGVAKPALGTVKAEADTKVSVSNRLVDFSVFQITDSNFPTLSD